jgi:fibronectin-binding autotransporter adhesin
MQGTGVLDLTGSSSSFTGKINLSDGTINASAATATGTGTVTVSNLGNFQVQGGVTLSNKFDISNTGGPTANGAIENVSGSNSITGAVTVSGASRIQSDSGTLTIAGATGLAGNSLDVGGSGNTTFTGAVTGTAASSLTKDGSGTLAMGVASPAFAGSVAINGGTLQTTVANAFKNTTAITFTTGSTLDLFSTSQAIGTLNGAGTVAFGSGGALTLTSGADLLSGAFTGSGTLTLSSGTTLTLGANFSDANLNIVLAGGTLKLNGTTDTFGSLSVTSNSVLDFANPSVSVLTVSGVSLTGTSQLSVTNWANMVDYFYSETSPGTQGQAPIDQIIFTGYAGSQTHWNTYQSGPGPGNEISPVPEAQDYGAIIVGCALAAIAASRRRARA